MGQTFCWGRWPKLGSMHVVRWLLVWFLGPQTNPRQGHVASTASCPLDVAGKENDPLAVLQWSHPPSHLCRPVYEAGLSWECLSNLASRHKSRTYRDMSCGPHCWPCWWPQGCLSNLSEDSRALGRSISGAWPSIDGSPIGPSISFLLRCFFPF